jgi:MFS family permease
VAILTVSLFVMGLGIGPLLVGPVSEFIGRRAVYLWSYIAFLRECSIHTITLRCLIASVAISIHLPGCVCE